MTLFDPDPYATEPEPAPDPDLSVGARLTARNRRMIEGGRHPATGLPLIDGHTCGDCAHHHAYDYHNGRFHKCDRHRLGESHSAASDIRVGWPACTLWTAEP